MKSFQVIGVGAHNIDFHHKTNHAEHKQILKSAVDGGGSAGNTMCNLSSLGLSCASVGAAGDDEYTNILFNSLHRFDIDTRYITKQKNKPNGQAHIYTDHRGKTMTYISPGANNDFDQNDINLTYLADAGWVHFSTFVNEKQFAIQSWIAQKMQGKVKTSYWFDEVILQYELPVIKKILRFIDTIFIKESTLNALTRLDSLESAQKFLHSGSKTIVVISNTNESTIITESDSFHIRTKKSSPHDESGAGCAYAAGYIFGQLNDYSIKRSGLIGNTMMSLCASKLGCRSNIPSRSDLMKHMGLVKEDKNILIVGSGGREHALAWKIQQSPHVHRLYVAPGNVGISEVARTVPIADSDITALKDFVKKNDIDLTIVGPEAPLNEGIVDEFEKDGLTIFGPSKKAATLESSKSFAKEFMKKFKIPTAPFKIFNEYKKALSYIKKHSYPLVIKADGLAAGKGVQVCKNRKSAEEWLKLLMVDTIFGDSGKQVVIENCLRGEEASVLAFTDGKHIIPLLPAQDHKPLLDNDEGPNTGGMGAYAPAPLVTPALLHSIVKKILQPTVDGMRKIKRTYKGILYAGLMITKEGPQVIEFNCRLGDPETQAILPLLQSDLLELIEATLLGTLDKIKIQWKNESCVCVIVASGGYPAKPQTGHEITGLKDLTKFPHADVFHSGTTSKIITSGGRVLGVYATGENLKDAIHKVYSGVKHVTFPAMHLRKDIGKKGL